MRRPVWLASADAVEAPFFTVERVLPWIADAHRENEKRFVVRADELLTAFLLSKGSHPELQAFHRRLLESLSPS